MPFLPMLFAFALMTADFTFQVPVSLQDYQQPASVVGSSQSVWCSVSAGTAELGRGHTPLAIPASGNYSATVTVQVSVRPGTRASDATDYKCWFSVSDDITAQMALSRGDLHARTGTTPVLLVSGHIPR